MTGAILTAAIPLAVAGLALGFVSRVLRRRAEGHE
jgi:hypothetical protein